MGDALLNSDDRSLMDVSSHKSSACSLEHTGVIKSEPIEYDEQEYMLHKIHTKPVEEKEPEDDSGKTEAESREEDGLNHVLDKTETKTNQNNISDPIKLERMEDDELESVGNKPKTQNKAESKQNDVLVDIKTEKVDKDENEYATVKKVNSNVRKHGRIDSLAMDAKAEFDLEEQVIVMNENTKFRNRVKPDTSTYSHFCKTCDMAFRWPQQLRNHIRFVHEGDFPYTCKICGKGFEHLKSFRDHKYVHTEERPHCCKLCPSRFKMRGGLNKHMRDIHEENKLKFKCEHCSKVFKCKEKLISHFVVHQSEKQFACEICGKKFNRKPNLKDHLVTHSKEKNFECTECGMKFNRKYAMKIHRRNHLEVRPYKCDFCDKSFSQSHALKSHVRLHTGERPYKCRYCDRAFKQLGTWQIHEKRHRGEKDFECGVCGRAFLIHRRLTEHMRTHTGEKPYKCSLCPYRGATSTGLKYHERTHERRLLREMKKALEAEMKENGTDFTTESVSKDTEAMQVALRKEFDNEVKKTSGQAVKSKTKGKKVKRNNDNITNVEVEKPEDSQLVKKTKRKTKHIIDKIVEDGVKRAPTMKKIKKDKKNKKNQGLLENSLSNMSENRNSFPPLGQNSPILLLTLAKDDKNAASVQAVKDEKRESFFIDLFQKNRETGRNKTTQLVLFDDTFSNGYTQNATELPNGAMHNGVNHGTSMIDEAIKNLADSIKRDCHGKNKFTGAPGVLKSGLGHKNGTQGLSLLNNTYGSKFGAPGISSLGNRHNHGAPNISLLSNNFGSTMSNDAPDIKPFQPSDIIELSSSSDSESDEKEVDAKFENIDGYVIQEDNDPTFGAKDNAVMDSDSEKETSDSLNVTTENYTYVITGHDSDSDREETWNGLYLDTDEVADTKHSDVEQSDTVVDETEDFIIIRNDSVSPFEQ